MFDLNEAPNAILAAISAEKAARGCGTFWSILCCVPTLGSSLGLCEEGVEGDWSGCCYPRSVSDRSNVTLNVLIDTLNELRVKRKDLPQGTNISKLIEWQVRETIRLLETVVEEDIIQGSYRTAIEKSLQALRTQATQEEKYANILRKDDIPLKERTLYVPDYGTSKGIKL